MNYIFFADCVETKSSLFGYAVMNAKQKTLALVLVPTFFVTDWFLGVRKIDAIVYSLVALFAGIAFYVAYFALYDGRSGPKE